MWNVRGWEVEARVQQTKAQKMEKLMYRIFFSHSLVMRRRDSKRIIRKKERQ